MSYLNVDEVATGVQNLAAAYPTTSQLITLPILSFEGRTCYALRIGGGATGSRDVLTIIGGQHAREWGSCEICLNLAADLLEAYGAGAGLAYGGKSFSAAAVREIVEGLHVVVFPLVNPDGRYHSQTVDTIGGTGGWRGNRNPTYPILGVDLNRNYDFLFDFRNKFAPAALTDFPALNVSDSPSSEVFHGPSAFSEPEVQNIRWLVEAFPRTRWFVDVHSYSQLVLYNWGDDRNQSTDPNMNFQNPAYDTVRGVRDDVAYREFIPNGDLAIAQALAQRVSDGILAVRNKSYTPEPGVNLYPTCGTSDDFAYSRQWLDPRNPKTLGFVIEWGTQFRPDWPEMERIVADVTAGLIELCTAAPCAGGLIAVTLDTPGLAFIDVPAGEETVRAAVFTVQTCSAVTFQVQPPGPVVTSGPGSFGLPVGGMVSLPSASNAAPRQVRIWVSFQGTAPNDVTAGSVTIRCLETSQNFLVPITANTIAPPRVASVLVLDQSASMDWDSGIPGKKRVDVLHESAPVYVSLLSDSDGIGVVSFDHDAYPIRPVVDAGAGGRAAAAGAIAAHTPNPKGNTAIGDGVELAHTTLQPLPGYDSKATVVFTDGQETSGRYIADVASLINERVFALGLGTAQQLNPIALSALTNNSGGYLLLTGELAAHDDLRVEKYFSQILAGVTNAEVVLDPEGLLLPGPELRIPFSLTEADRAASVLVLSPAPWAMDFWLETPAAGRLDPAAAGALPGTEFVPGDRVHFYRITLPVPIDAGAHRGTWHAVLSLPREKFRKYLSKERQGVSAAHGIPYSFNVHAFSTVRMRCAVTQDNLEPGAHLSMRAVLTESGLPIERRAAVVAEVDHPDGVWRSIPLVETEPGVFVSTIHAGTAGIYRTRFRARGTTLRGFPFTREQLRTPAVWQGGSGSPPSTGTGARRPIDWCQFVECLLSQKGVPALLDRHGLSLEELQRCWKAQCRADRGPPS